MNTQSPTTEAGRRLVAEQRDPCAIYTDDPGAEDWESWATRAVRAIEEAARAEGRREAVREIRERLTDGRGHSLNVDIGLLTVLDALNEVAGVEAPERHGIGTRHRAVLNASESPPRVSILDSDPAEGEGMDDWLGDASESPPTQDNADENERQAWADVDAGVADRIGVDDPGWGMPASQSSPRRALRR